MATDNLQDEQQETMQVRATAQEPSANTKRIRASLKKLTCPTYDSVWLGPFEQLVGSGYALLAAERYGIHQRNLDRYNERVQRKIVEYLDHLSLGDVQPHLSGLNDWFSGFYFKAGIQRIV